MKNNEQKKRKNKKKQHFTNKTNLTQKAKKIKMKGEDMYILCEPTVTYNYGQSKIYLS